MEKDAALRELESLAGDLAREGKQQLAERVREAIVALRVDGHRDAEVMSPAEAATLLGIGNDGMIGRWSREGLLEGCRVGGAYGSRGARWSAWWRARSSPDTEPGSANSTTSSPSSTSATWN